MPREENRAVTRTISGRASWSTWSSASPADEVEAAAPAGHGTPFARTFVRTLNYGSATIKAERVGSERTPTIALVDLRTEKTFVIGRTRVMGIFDLYKPFQHECGAGSHHQFGPLVAEADDDHRSPHPADRCAPGMV